MPAPQKSILVGLKRVRAAGVAPAGGGVAGASTLGRSGGAASTLTRTAALSSTASSSGLAATTPKKATRGLSAAASITASARRRHDVKLGRNVRPRLTEEDGIASRTSPGSTGTEDPDTSMELLSKSGHVPSVEAGASLEVDVMDAEVTPKAGGGGDDVTPSSEAMMSAWNGNESKYLRPFMGRAKRIVHDELLPINLRGRTVQQLLFGKQAKLLLYEDYLHKGGKSEADAAFHVMALEAKKASALEEAQARAREAVRTAESSEIMRLRREVAELRRRLDAAHSEAASGAYTDKADMQAMKQAHQRELEAIAVAHDAEVDALKEALSKAASEAAVASSNLAEEEREELERSHEASMEAAVKKARAELQAAASRKLAAAEAAWSEKERALSTRVAQLQSEVDDLQDELNRTSCTAESREASLQAELEAMRAAAQQAEARAAASDARAHEFQHKFEVCDAKRRTLQEDVLTLKGNIRVFARVRPALATEAADAPATSARSASAARGRGKAGDAAPALPPLFQFPDAKSDATTLEVVEKPGAGVGGYGVGEAKHTRFDYNRVFTPTDDQERVFEEVEGLVHSAIDGHRVCIFAYGQTGSGKTFTMIGGPSNARGIIPRALEYVFTQLQALAGNGWKWRMTVEMLEIYNEDVRDLLVSSPSAAAAAAAAGKYEIKHDKDGNTSVVGLTVKEVRTMADVDALMKVAAAARSTGATHSNAHSSRSHSVYTMRLYLDHSVTAQSRSGILHMIDLAGSERIAKSGVNNMEAGGSEKLLKETQNINKSLSCLSTVVMALKAGASHVPFRNSKLTYLLQHSLGGNCKTLMLCNLNPLHAHTSESLATLRFAKAVTEVTNAPGAAGGVAAAGAGAAH